MPHRPPAQMALGSFAYAFGYHPAAWLQPGVPHDAATSLAHWVELARIAERGKMDFIFIADSPAVAPGPNESIARWTNSMNRPEPLTLLAAMAAQTTHIGLAATLSTSFYEPYNVARLFGMLDHVSHGRASWNVVTSDHQATSYNFGLDGLEPHALRYEKAREFFDIVCGLWDSYDDDAFICDPGSGYYFHPDRLHPLDHKGKHYSVRGPLNLARPPQGRPVIAQAGGSEAGKEFAAETAEVVFSIGSSIEESRAFYADLKGRMAKFGRAPDQLKVMPGIPVYVGRTEEEADEKLARLGASLNPAAGLSALQLFMTGVDFSGLDLDQPVPASRIDSNSNASKAIFGVAEQLLRQEGMTLRQMISRWAAQGSHTLFKGSPKQVVDQMEEWFSTGAADGFMVMHPVMPHDLTDFVELVVPELQRRGLYREDYSGTMLRDHLGLARPASRYAAPPARDEVA
ncbi:LLM class flavin-dependent oxidoreductase [Ancylobacter sp. MQZ15Z-1]|uniref:LLM class flavin-dependent oxidoreductase n=1 Tax=Ancylobacter mangrovi TaxID=2972472 RepID=A0A9X2PER8_9HYPH|nr:LLM class flavin-dependent oxidoreductase [Ancylobacter mangrovi]MCS0495526.1 LLM class flavin-dependent oxidoreductase [Ancylobacter mangrovi]